MSGFKGSWSAVLGATVAAARAVLRDLDEKEIPAGLSRVAAYQGGRLPPPLSARLLKELDENQWLRAKVAEEVGAAADDASRLFLERPAGWWIALAEMEAAAATGRHDQTMAELEGRLRQSEEKRLLATRRAKELKKEAAAAKQSARDRADSAKSAAERRFTTELEQAAALREQLQVERARHVELDARHVQLQNAFAVLRARLAKARRGRVDQPDSGGASSSLPSDPVKLARMLDLQASALGRDSERAKTAKPELPDPLLLRAGVRPDSSDAIRWLVGLEEPVVVLVDGYNAQFHIDREDFTSGSARRQLVGALKRLRAAAAKKHRFVVVYDSTLPGDRDARTSLGGVEVRFAVEERIADEEIVEMAADIDRVVVISSDRAVRDGAEARGAVVLWSEALADWLARA